MRRDVESGFVLSSKQIRNDIFIPRYYDPRINQRLKRLGTDDILIPKYYNPQIQDELSHFADFCDLKSVGELIDEDVLNLDTGDEIGRLNYGTGQIAFVRTSDLGTYELKADSKHGIDDGTWEQYRQSQDVNGNDILLVRDGTYLVGSSTLIFDQDLPLVYCGGIYKIASLQPQVLSSGLCYALLNTPVVRRQMRSKQFTRDVIDTLGQRIREVVLPIPKDPAARRVIDEFVIGACQQRVKMRANLYAICESLF